MLIHVASPGLCLPLFLKMSYLSLDALRIFTLQSQVKTTSSETFSLTSQAGLLEPFVYSYCLKPTYSALVLDWCCQPPGMFLERKDLCFIMLVLTGRDRRTA